MPLSKKVNLIKLSQACKFIKKRLRHRFFPVNFVKFLGVSLFLEHLWWMLLTFLIGCYYEFRWQLLRSDEDYKNIDKLL